MNTSISDALRTLHDADPAGSARPGVNVDSSWHHFLQMRDDALISDAAPPQRRGTRAVLVAATLVTVLLAALVLALTTPRPGSTHQPGQTPPAFATSAAQARLIGERFLDRLAQPRGSRPSSVRVGPLLSCTGDCLIVTATVSVPGGIRDALDFYSRHLPPGFTVAERGATSLGVGAGTSAAGVAWLQFDMGGQGARTAVRIDASVPWYPPNRSAAEQIPTPASVTASYGNDFLSAPHPIKTVQRTLTSAQADDVIQALNAASTWNPTDPKTCFDLPNRTALALTITAGRHRYQARQYGGSCVIHLTRDSVTQPDLFTDLAPLVLKALGVPTH